MVTPSSTLFKKADSMKVSIPIQLSSESDLKEGTDDSDMINSSNSDDEYYFKDG
jgi:hypothetical protein